MSHTTFNLSDHLFPPATEGKFDFNPAPIADALVAHLYLSPLSPTQVLEILTNATHRVSADCPDPAEGAEPLPTDLP